MASVKYTYSIQNDFPNHKVASDRLAQEIRSSAILIALDYISTSGDNCDIWFKYSISTADHNVLDALVAVHSGQPLVSTMPEPVRLYAADDSPIQYTSDGKLIQLPCLFPPGMYMYFAGRGDDVTAGRGQGQHFRLAKDTSGEDSMEFQFNDWILLAGGDGYGINGEFGDWITFEALAPASSTSPNGSNQGNCNLVEVAPGAHIIVPAANNGTHDVNLTTAVPVPAGKPGEKTGFWEWDWPDEGKGSITPGVPQQSEFNLYDFPITLARQLPFFQLLGSRRFELTVPAVNPSAFLPQWKGKCIIHNETGHAGLKVVWTLVCARYKTV